MAAIGQRWRLEEINAGHKLVHRMAELGLTHGVTLQVLQGAGGPMLVAVRGSRIAIGRGMAHKMMVTPAT